MPIREEPWTHGTPTLLTLTTTDPRRCAELYANLLGWDLTPQGLPVQGLPVVATIAGHVVAAFLAGEQDTGWTTHLLVDDIYSAMGISRAAGATMSDPIRLGEHGTMTLGTDPEGAGLGLWQPNSPESLVGQEGTLLWSELLVRDVAAAKVFYDVLMDARFEDADDEGSYVTVLTRDGELVAGLGEIGDEFADDIPAHWMPYLDCDDLAETYALAGTFGAEPVMEPTESELGAIAILRGVGGEVFGLMQLPADHTDDTDDAAEANGSSEASAAETGAAAIPRL